MSDYDFRWQPVYVKDEDAVFICLVDINKDGKLEDWGSLNDGASGSSDELSTMSIDLAHMFIDSIRWKRVNYDELRVGMTFERVSKETVKATVAKLVEHAMLNEYPYPWEEEGVP